MHCAACAQGIESALRKVRGVQEAGVNFATRRATVAYDASQVGPARLVEAIRAAGYDAAEPGSDGGGGHAHGSHVHEDEAPEAARRKLWVAAALSTPVVVLAMSHGALSWLDHRVAAWIQLALTAPVVLWCGADFFRGGWAALKRGAADMNTLVALGTGMAFFASAAATIVPDAFAGSGKGGPPPIYFESAAVIVTLILLGRTLEARARGRASDAILALLRLAPDRARVLRGTAEVEVPVADLAVGDVIVVRPGE